MAKPRRRIKEAYLINAPLPTFGESSEMDLFDYLETFKRTEFDSGEKKLAAAILEEAVNALREGAAIYGSVSREETLRRKKKAAWEARDWFVSPETNLVHSFICVCETLHIEADYLRPRILKLGPIK